MRKLASIRRIDSVRPIQGFDKVDLAEIGGWYVIVRKGEFSAGDLCVYCEIDSVMPDHPAFEFLGDKRRIRTKKIRGVVSQGIAFPLSLLDQFPTETGLTEGTDVTDVIGVTKHEASDFGVKLQGLISMPFPRAVPKTDEERVQNLSIAQTVEDYGQEWVVTEKVDGTSFTVMVLGDEVHICGRNVCFKPESDNAYCNMARKHNLPAKLLDACHGDGIEGLALQGEIVGPGIQKNRQGVDEVKPLFYYAFNIGRQEYLTDENFDTLCAELGLETVPKLGTIVITKDTTADSLLKWADGFSRLNESCRREGVVFHTWKKTPLSPFGRVSFKAVSNEYLLNGGEE